MSGITVLSPVGINRVEARPITPRLRSLDGVAAGGFRKRDVQRFLFEQARNRVGTLKLRAMYKAENWPDWVDANDDEARCPIVGEPEDIHVAVTGRPGKHSAFIPTFGTSRSVTRRIEPPGR